MNRIDMDISPQSSPIRQLQSDCPRARITTALLRIAHDESKPPLSPKQIQAISARVHRHILETSADEEENIENQPDRMNKHEALDQTIQQCKLLHCGEKPIVQLPVLLGEGQNGSVMLGITSDGKCAIKPRNCSPTAQHTKTTEEAEINALQTLSDVPGVINLVAVNDICIVLEFCNADLNDLIDYIRRGEYNLPEGDLHSFCKQIAVAISEIHQKGIIHSDLKPDNIMLIMEGDIIKIADFNYSVSSSAEIHGGSFIYYPPEQLANIYFEHYCQWNQETKREEWVIKENELRSALKQNDLKKVKQLISEIETVESRIAPLLSPAIDVWSGGLVMAQLSLEYLSAPFQKRLNEYLTTMADYARHCNGNPFAYATMTQPILEQWQTEWVQKDEDREWSGIFAGLQPTNEIEKLLTKALDFDPSTRISSCQMRQYIFDQEEKGCFLASPIAPE